MSFKDKTTKIAIITNMPTPYRKKQFEYYSKYADIDLTVYYCTKIENDRFWRFKSSEGVNEIFLKGFNFFNFHFNPSIIYIVLMKRYDFFMVGGFSYPTVIISIILLRILKKKWVMISDGISPKRLTNEKWYVKLFKKFILNCADAYFINGISSQKNFQSYGIKRNKIFNQYLTVDVDNFIEKQFDGLKCREKIRSSYNINNSIVLNYTGRLISKKGIENLIIAIKLLNQKYDLFLFIIGEGNFKQELEEISDEIIDRVIFTGHVDPYELYKYYYASDIFVLPTLDDPWGLVVNEAMACQLPIIVTDAAGCSADLIKNNGYIIKAGDVKELTKAIEDLIDPKTRRLFGKNSRKIISKWTYNESANSFRELIKYLNR